jgi:hypothetical protein
MQDDKIGQKSMAPADMARLPNLINAKIVLVGNYLVHQWGLNLL